MNTFAIQSAACRVCDVVASSMKSAGMTMMQMMIMGTSSFSSIISCRFFIGIRRMEPATRVREHGKRYSSRDPLRQLTFLPYFVGELAVYAAGENLKSELLQLIVPGAN